MRILLPALISLSLCGSAALAQVPASGPKAAVPAASPAAARFQQLADQHSERMKGVGRDVEKRAKALAERAKDLIAFTAEFAKSPEANRARLEIAQVARMQKDDAELAKAAAEALAQYDPTVGDLQGLLTAANTANALELADLKAKLVDQAVVRAKTIAERIDLATMLRQGMKDNDRAEQVLAAAEAAAKTDEDRAELGLGKANLVRRSSKDKGPYQEALAAVAAQFPNTKAGKLAAAKIQAANLAPGSDPVAFTTTDLEGKSVSPADYQGKVLLIDFWATWCGPCMAELPHVLKAYEAYHDRGFEILGISLDRDSDRAKLDKVIAEKNMSWRHVYDGKYWQAEIAVLHDVQAIPFTILIGKDGKVVGTNLRGDKLSEAVAKALEQ
ncbi:MAG: TlpA family protein disulfide reductase [Planctomycetes bacterium]|nr:TlpA family protein disulfide reductase [Planctomycetota bacterium]